MTIRNFALLCLLLILVGCNQSDSDSKAPSADNTGTGNEQYQTDMKENAATAQTEPEREGNVLARVNGQPIYENAHTREDLEFAINEKSFIRKVLDRVLIKNTGIRLGLMKNS